MPELLSSAPLPLEFLWIRRLEKERNLIIKAEHEYLTDYGDLFKTMIEKMFKNMDDGGEINGNKN